MSRGEQDFIVTTRGRHGEGRYVVSASNESEARKKVERSTGQKPNFSTERGNTRDDNYRRIHG